MDEDNKDAILLSTFTDLHTTDQLDNHSDHSDNLSDATDENESLLDVHSSLNAEPERAPNMKDFFCVAWVTFLGEMSRGVVVPVLWPYLQILNGTLEFLGFVSSGFSFSRFFAAPFFGWWSNWRGHREVMLICLVLLVIGNVIYAVYPPPWLLLLSRIIIGLGAGTLGQSRGYVSQVTTKTQRTRYMAYLTVSQFAGFAVTPGITSLLSLSDFDVFGLKALEADEYTSAGYLMALLSLITLPFVFFGFKEPPKQVSVKQKQENSEPITRGGVVQYIKTAFKSIPAMFSHPEINKIILFSVLIFATRTAVAVVETASSQVAWNSFQWDSQILSYILCAMGVVGTIILILLPTACQRIGEYGEGLLLCVGVFSLGIGMALMTPPSKYSFVIGLLFTWALGSAMSQTLIMSFLSRVLHPDSQGAVMGFLASLGSVSRIIGAMWTGAALGSSGGAYMALGVPAALMVPCLLGTIAIVIQMIRAANNRKI